MRLQIHADQNVPSVETHAAVKSSGSIIFDFGSHFDLIHPLFSGRRDRRLNQLPADAPVSGLFGNNELVDQRCAARRLDAPFLGIRKEKVVPSSAVETKDTSPPR